MKFSKKFLALTVLLGATMLSGCGKKDEEKVAGGQQGENKKIEVKDTLVFGQLSDPKTLNPQLSTDNYSQIAMTQVYDRLFEINEKTGEAIPSLVKEYKRIDNNTLELTLNDKVRFHNGDYLTSEDIKFTLEKAIKSPVVGHLYKLIDTIEIKDDMNLVIKTKEPFAPLLNHLSHKSSSILNKKAFESMGEEAYFANPIGTGAYKVKSWSLGDRIALEAVPGYFKGDAKIKNVILKSVPEENSKIIGLETGELDMIYDVPAISWESLNESKDTEVITSPSTNTGYLGLNTQKGILADKDVRKAVAMAVDKDSLIDAIYLGKVMKAEQFISPPVFGYDPTNKSLPLNIEEGKKIVEAKGLTGAKLKIAVSSPERVQVATIIQAQLKEIGLELEIELLEWGTFLAETGKGNADMFIMGWGPSTYDGDYGYYPNLHSAQLGGNGNRAFYNNQEMDKYLDLARKELDSTKRKEYYNKIQKLVSEDNPVIPLYHANTVYGLRSNLKNVEASGYPVFYKYEFTN